MGPNLIVSFRCKSLASGWLSCRKGWPSSSNAVPRLQNTARNLTTSGPDLVGLKGKLLLSFFESETLTDGSPARGNALPGNAWHYLQDPQAVNQVLILQFPLLTLRKRLAPQCCTPLDVNRIQHALSLNKCQTCMHKRHQKASRCLIQASCNRVRYTICTLYASFVLTLSRDLEFVTKGSWCKLVFVSPPQLQLFGEVWVLTLKVYC